MHSSAFSLSCCSKLLSYLFITCAPPTNDCFTSIDLLASKLVFTDQKYPSSQSRHGPGSQRFTSQKDEFAAGRGEHVVEFHGGTRTTQRRDSQENILKAGSTAEASIDLEEMDVKGNVIRKTVEFKIV